VLSSTFLKVFSRGLLVKGVQQIEEVFSLARTKARASRNMVGVGSKDISEEQWERRKFGGFPIYYILENYLKFQCCFAGI